MTLDCDLFVIGGGINGTAVARDAAGRGLKIVLAEKDDLAQHTSSSSTKLIHGGLRYLEQYEFRLVREALKERDVLLRAAPHIISPMRFVLPHEKGLRPKWILKAGLFLYDSLAGKSVLPDSEQIKLTGSARHRALKSEFTDGFEYSDCWVEDARLVVLNAVAAREKGADIRTHTRVESIEVAQGHYLVTMKNMDGSVETLSAKGVVNAAGPWVDQIMDKVNDTPDDDHLRLVKGSHIVVDQLFEGDHAYIFQNKDGRVVFAIPYEQAYTLIGTTDVPFKFEDGKPKASSEEISYLCTAASEYFKSPVTPEDVRWTYSGVRPLYDDKSDNASEVTRDYVLDVDVLTDNAPFLSVYGGKITTSRKLAAHALKALSEYFPDMGEKWTATTSLPGGDIPNGDFDAFYQSKLGELPKLASKTILRLCRYYGSRLNQIMADSTGFSEMICGDISAAEVDYLVEHEWARSADDILWRRTKTGLHIDGVGVKALEDYLAS